MFVKIYLVLCLFSKFLFVISWKPTADYCKMKCGKEEHTACNCKVIEPRKIIDDDPKKFRQEMVNVHNLYRNTIASGGEKDKDYPEAANMMAVSYSLELEYIAKCYAGVFTKMHDKCRSKANPPISSGQNLAANSDINQLKSKPADMATKWYKELDNVISGKVNRENFINKFDTVKYKKPEKKIGHFSQFIWWSVNLVGCARVHNDKIKNPIWQNVLICNYGSSLKDGEGGNVLDQPIYKIGDKCSACPENTKCNSEYPALCGTIEKVPAEEVPLGKPSSRTTRIYQNRLLLVFFLLVLRICI